MRTLSFILSLLLFASCSSNKYSVSKIIDGNSFELSNGVIVRLAGVGKNEENIKIMERYLKEEVLLFDCDNEEINQFSSDQIIAFAYNSDGDCISQLLSNATEITKDKPIEPSNSPETSAKFSIPFEVENGILKIPVEINDESLYFIFDTGASLISISQTVADQLYESGKLTDKDFIGKSIFWMLTAILRKVL